MSEIGTLRPDGSVKEFDNGVGGKDGRVGIVLKCPKLVLDEVGVSPGTASKKSAFDGDGDSNDESSPRLA
jgi:hypothetical protein